MPNSTVNFLRSCLCNIIAANDELVNLIHTKLKELDIGRCHLAQLLANLLNCMDDDSFNFTSSSFDELISLCVELQRRYNTRDSLLHPRDLTLIGKQQKMRFQLDYSLFESYPYTLFSQLAYRNDNITPEGFVYIDFDEFALGITCEILKGFPYDVSNLTYEEIHEVDNIFKYFQIIPPQYISDALKQKEVRMNFKHLKGSEQLDQSSISMNSSSTDLYHEILSNNIQENQYQFTDEQSHLNLEDLLPPPKSPITEYEINNNSVIKNIKTNENEDVDDHSISLSYTEEINHFGESHIHENMTESTETDDNTLKYNSQSIQNRNSINVQEEIKSKLNTPIFLDGIPIDKVTKPSEALEIPKFVNPIFNSTIVEEKYNDYLLEWIGHRKTWHLAYKGSVDGFGASDFHNHCDNIGESLVFIRAITEAKDISSGNLVKTKCIFGGYTKVGWTTNGLLVSSGIADEDAFIFTLQNPHHTSPMIFRKGNSSYYPIEYQPNFGPIFSLAIYIHDHCNMTERNLIYSDPQKPVFTQDPTYGATLFTYSSFNKKRNSFIVDEIELFTTNQLNS